MIGRGLAVTTVAALALAPAALPAKPTQGEHTLSLAAKPNPVVFGATATLSGALAGPAAAGESVTLEHDATAPLGDKFSPAGEKATTGTDGSFSFAVTPDVNTRYRVVAKTRPSTESKAVPVRVRPRVELTVSDRTPAKGSRVRFEGTVAPAHDGAVARVQRRRSGAWKTVARASLADAGEGQSSYTKRVRVGKDGVYRVKVAKDADHAAGLSARVRIDVS